jgi:hypothetical protein
MSDNLFLGEEFIPHLRYKWYQEMMEQNEAKLKKEKEIEFENEKDCEMESLFEDSEEEEIFISKKKKEIYPLDRIGLDPKLTNDYNYMQREIYNNPKYFSSASKELKNNKKFILELIENSCLTFPIQDLNPKFLQDKEIIRALVQFNVRSLSRARL